MILVGLYNTKPKRAMVAMVAIIPNLGRFPGWRLRFAMNPVIRLRPDGPVYLDSLPNTFMFCNDAAFCCAFAIPAN